MGEGNGGREEEKEGEATRDLYLCIYKGRS